MLRSIGSLARWLGPWASPARVPAIERRDEALGDLRVAVYHPRGRPRAAYLIAPGLHYAGADDPRMDRFCRVLAASGHLVIAPFVPDYLALTPNARAIADFERVFHALPRWTDRKPVVFSISFGSLLAFALAGTHGDRLDGVVVFGGYADFNDTMRFCLTGHVPSGRRATRDPLNQAVVLMNLIELIDCADRREVVAAWRRWVERTWGRPELKARERFVPIAHEMAASVPANVRELFLVGVGAQDGAFELAAAALAKYDARALDPTPHLARIRGRVDLVHGTDDDVIPYEQSHTLAERLTAADVRLHVTGLYGHTATRMPRVSALAKEAVTAVRVLRALAR